jgi:hypothetical protein
MATAASAPDKVRAAPTALAPCRRIRSNTWRVSLKSTSWGPPSPASIALSALAPSSVWLTRAIRSTAEPASESARITIGVSTVITSTTVTTPAARVRPPTSRESRR